MINFIHFLPLNFAEPGKCFLCNLVKTNTPSSWASRSWGDCWHSSWTPKGRDWIIKLLK